MESYAKSHLKSLTYISDSITYIRCIYARLKLARIGWFNGLVRRAFHKAYDILLIFVFIFLVNAFF